MTGGMLVPIVTAQARLHYAAEDVDGAIASVEVALHEGRLLIDVSLDDDRYPVVVTVKPA